MTLPDGFAALEPFVAQWAIADAAGRDAMRGDSTPEARQAFYEAMNPLLAAALDRLDATPLAQHDPAEQRLMQLALSYAHVALAIEVQGPDEAKHTANRRQLHITRAPADS